MQIGPNLVARGSYGPPCQVPRWYWRYWTGSTPRCKRDRQLPEGRPDEVGGSQRDRGSELRGLLPLEAGVDGQLALALQGDALTIQPTGEHHPAKESPEVLGAEADVGITDGCAVGSQDALRLGAGPVHGRLVGRLGHG